jgi:hypothetical protein
MERRISKSHPGWERIATIEEVKNAMAEQLEGGRFADWINIGTLL